MYHLHNLSDEIRWASVSDLPKGLLKEMTVSLSAWEVSRTIQNSTFMGLPGGWGIKTKQNFIGLQHKTARPNFAKQYEPDKYRSTLTKTPQSHSWKTTNFCCTQVLLFGQHFQFSEPEHLIHSILTVQHLCHNCWYYNTQNKVCHVCIYCILPWTREATSTISSYHVYNFTIHVYTCHTSTPYFFFIF